MAPGPDTQALNRRLLLLKLAAPGGGVFGRREDELFLRLGATGWLTFAIRRYELQGQSDDISQEVHLSLCEEIRLGVLHSLNSEYIKTKVRNLANAQWRRQRRVRPADPATLADKPGPTSSGESAPALATLSEALSRLPERQRYVLERQFPGLVNHSGHVGRVEKATLQSLADEFGLSVSTVHRWKSEGIRMLADTMRLSGYDEWAYAFERGGQET